MEYFICFIWQQYIVSIYCTSWNYPLHRICTIFSCQWQLVKISHSESGFYNRNIQKESPTTLRKDFVILQLYWWLFSSTKYCNWNIVYRVVILQSYFPSYNYQQDKSTYYDCWITLQTALKIAASNLSCKIILVWLDSSLSVVKMSCSEITCNLKFMNYGNDDDAVLVNITIALCLYKGNVVDTIQEIQGPTDPCHYCVR